MLKYIVKCMKVFDSKYKREKANWEKKNGKKSKR